MFDFFKSEKKLTDQLAMFIVVEIGMFQSWTLEFRHTDLTPEELDLVIYGILKREGISTKDDQPFMLRLMALANTNFDQMEELRKKFSFDQKIESYCRGVGLSEEYWTPWVSTEEIGRLFEEVDSVVPELKSLTDAAMSFLEKNGVFQRDLDISSARVVFYAFGGSYIDYLISCIGSVGVRQRVNSRFINRLIQGENEALVLGHIKKFKYELDRYISSNGAGSKSFLSVFQIESKILFSCPQSEKASESRKMMFIYMIEKVFVDEMIKIGAPLKNRIASIN